MLLGITDFWTYVIGAFLITVLPGPNSLFVLSTAAQRGTGAGYRAAAGVLIGDTVLMALASAGAASLLQSTSALYSTVKYAGAGYLAWVGIGMFRKAWLSWRSGGTAADDAEPPREGRPFPKALVISLLNPKMTLFFVSFFTQFVDPSYGAPALSFLTLGVIIQIFSALFLTVLIFSGAFVSAQFQRRRKLSAGLISGAGALFVAFGASLATVGLG